MNNSTISTRVQVDFSQEREDDWSIRFMESLPQHNQNQILLFDNIPDEIMSEEIMSDEMMSENSESTTILLMDFDDDDNDEDATVQQQEISSSTPTITTLNAVNTMKNKMRNAWMLQPALNSVYNSMNPIPSSHFRQSTGDSQMNFIKQYDNALMTPLVQNMCLVRLRDTCPMKTIQNSLFDLMSGMEKYSALPTAEQESLVTNFNYLAELVAKMEAGLRAQREWNTVIQSLRHRSNHPSSSSITTDLETMDLPYLVKTSTHRCSEQIMDDQIPMTTLYEQYQRVLPAKIMENNSHWSEQEIVAHRMYMLMVQIQEMSNEINNKNINFL